MSPSSLTELVNVTHSNYIASHNAHNKLLMHELGWYFTSV